MFMSYYNNSSKQRTIRFTNDGRAPDTTKALLGSGKVQNVYIT